jgi:hypothetical protein
MSAISANSYSRAHARTYPRPGLGAGSLVQCYAAKTREMRADRVNNVTELEQIA